jgi:hypothetical protein
LVTLGALIGGTAVVGPEAPAWAQRLAEARRARPVLTLDLGQWDLVAVRHPIFGSEAYYVTTADIAKALSQED